MNKNVCSEIKRISQPVPLFKEHDFASPYLIYSEVDWPTNKRFRPLQEEDAALFEARASLGCIIRPILAADCYNLTEVADFEETWSHSLIIVFRSGFQYQLHCGKRLTRVMGAPADVALAHYRRLKLETGVLDDTDARPEVHIDHAARAMGLDLPYQRARRRAALH